MSRILIKSAISIDSLSVRNKNNLLRLKVITDGITEGPLIDISNVFYGTIEINKFRSQVLDGIITSN